MYIVKDLRIVLLVSSDKSDLYFANQLMQRLNVLSVVIEHQQDTPLPVSKTRELLSFFIKPRQLFQRVIEKIEELLEEKYAVYNRPKNQLDFGVEGEKIIPIDNVLIFESHGKNSINSTAVINQIKEIKPDIIAVCGTSLLNKEILSLPVKGALNLHGGLAQQYRGLWTTDWAVYNEEPEYIGATVHFISPGIDDGEILYQGRPIIELNDNPHTLYEKVVKLGVNMMEQSILDIQNNSQKPAQLKQKGKLYLDYMTTPEIRRLTWNKLSTGIINNYLNHKKERDKKVIDLLVNVYQVDESLPSS